MEGICDWIWVLIVRSFYTFRLVELWLGLMETVTVWDKLRHVTSGFQPITVDHMRDGTTQLKNTPIFLTFPAKFIAGTL